MSIDIKKTFRDLYAPPSGRFVEVDVPELTYLAIDGHGDPNTSAEYAQAIEALYTSAYSIRAAFKARTGEAFVVGPLEGLWSSADPGDFAARNKSAWDWTMLMALPPEASDADVRPGLDAASTKKPHLPIVRIERLTEGRSLQILHIGSYNDEAPTLERLHRVVMPELGVTWNGRHHEIYLSDPRRVAPEKLKTVLRQPVRSL